MVDTTKMFAQSAKMIVDIAAHPLPLVSGMDLWFDYCDKVAPDQKSLWKRLRKLDFEKDSANLTKWLERLLRKEPPQDKVNGLWFGLFNPELDDGEVSCQMYVGGSTGFNPNSTSNEWVCQLTWMPKGRYSSSQVLTELYRPVETISKNQVSYLGEAFLCHGYIALVVSHWCHGPMRVNLLGNAAIRAVVMGHDSGDFYRISVLTAEKVGKQH
ncbi:MAG: hypothetical protein JNJ77_08605 [Planctomycetia bacterium]|nr:hypothetical protein [Planctomycetia bacterium]